MQEKWSYVNSHQIPKLEKIIINMGVSASLEKGALSDALKEMTVISGRKPVTSKAKRSVSNFKLREGMDIGLKVTLRGGRMYEFLDRLISMAIPRIRDFRGLNPKGFDGRGNFSMGLTEQTVFPEVDPDKVEFQQGMNITVVTSARNDSESRRLLTAMGMPFRHDEETAEA